MNIKWKIFFKSSQYIAYLSGFELGVALMYGVLENWVLFWLCLIVGLCGIPLWVSKIREEDD